MKNKPLEIGDIVPTLEQLADAREEIETMTLQERVAMMGELANQHTILAAKVVEFVAAKKKELGIEL